MSRDASFVTERNRARMLFAAKVLQETAVQTNLKNSVNLEGPLNHPMSFNPHYYLMKEGGQFTTPEEYNTLINSFFSLPGAPISLSAAPDDGQLTISFTEPSDGGTPITNYEYYPLDASGADWTAFSPPVTSSPVVITGLPNGSPLRFKLRAVNVVGPGAESAIVTGTPNILDFDYPDFSSTSDLALVSTSGVIGNALYLTTATNNDVGNVYRSTAIPYNRNFTFEWNFECSGGTGADGFCLQWTPTNNTNGGIGGACGYVNTAIQALFFKTVNDDTFFWYNNDVFKSSTAGQDFYRNLFYWADYNHTASTMNIYFSTTNTKPGSANFSLTGFSFVDATNYYIGFGAATGGLNQNNILRSMKLTFT